MNHGSIRKIKDYWVLYLFLLPAIGLTMVFSYLPMVGNAVAFMDYNLFDGFLGLNSPWVGFKYFAFLQEKWFYELAGRTTLYSFSILVFSFPASIVLALLLNELRNAMFKKIVQTVSYIPHFVSWVTVSGFFYIFLSYDSSGLVNNLMEAWFGHERVVWMQDTGLFLPLLIISQLWKEIGWGSILYLAAITTIDLQLYEAAKVDGAGRWKQLVHVTLPHLVPTTIVLIIFSMAGLFSTNFDQLINFQNPVIQSATNTIDTFGYYKGVREQQFSLAAAVGLFSGLINLTLMMSTNYIAKKSTGSGII